MNRLSKNDVSPAPLDTKRKDRAQYTSRTLLQRIRTLRGKDFRGGGGGFVGRCQRQGPGNNGGSRADIRGDAET